MSEVGALQNLLRLARQGEVSRPLDAALRLVAGELPAGIRVGDRLPVSVVRSASVPALVKIQGAPLNVELAGWRPGATLTAVVTQLTPQPTFQLAAGPAFHFAAQSVPAGIRLGDATPLTIVQAADLSLVVNFQGKQLTVQMPALPPGTELNARWTQLTPRPVLEAALPVLNPATPLPRLRAGDIVAVQVLRELPGGTVQIALGGVPLEAEAPPGIAPGSQLNVQVASLQPQLVLHILDREALPESPLLPLLRNGVAGQADGARTYAELQALLDLRTPTDSTGEPAGAGLTRLRNQLAALLPERGPPPFEQIVRLVQDGGLHYEAKLARAALAGATDIFRQVAASDLKGLLLHALGSTQTAAPVTADPATQPLTGFLQQLEAQQALNLLAKARNLPYQLQLPIQTPQGLTTAALAIEADEGGNRQGGRQEAGYNLFFSLDLEGLGPTRIDAHLTKDTARVLFYLKPGEPLARLEADLPAFQQALRALGFAEVLTAARPLSELAPEQRTKLQALAAGLPAAMNLVDARG